MKVLLLIGAVLFLAAAQDLINRAKIEGSQDKGDCWLRIHNTEQILDFRTDCALGNSTERPAYESLLQFVKPSAAYLIKEKGRDIWGYRYFKDPLNYMFAYYNLSTYELAFEQLINQFGLSSVKLPFDEKYTVNLEYFFQTDSWKLTTLEVKYHNYQSFKLETQQYSVLSWVQKPESVEKSIGTRRIQNTGDYQPVNVTLQLSPLDREAVESYQECRVVIEQILPEWFFISYDDLHTMDKFQVFDIEMPAHFAKQYFFRYYVPLTKFKKTDNKYTLIYPMRIRYPPPGDSYTATVGLHPNDKITMECGAKVFQIEEDLLGDRGHKEVYAGKESDTQAVTIATYAITLLVCVWSLRKLKKSSGL